MKLKNVIIGTVSDENTVTMEYTFSLVETVKEALKQNIVLHPILCRSSGNTTMRINQLITMAWKEKVDAIVLVSPNASWTSECLMALTQSETEVIALPVCGPNGFFVGTTEVERLQTNKKGEIKIQRTGLEFMKLSSEVLNSLCESAPSIQYEGNEVKVVIGGLEQYSSYATDAEILFSRTKECGYEVWLNPNHTVQTSTVHRTQGDFSVVLKEAKGE
jgi:hypothetical protein